MNKCLIDWTELRWITPIFFFRPSESQVRPRSKKDKNLQPQDHMLIQNPLYKPAWHSHVWLCLVAVIHRHRPNVSMGDYFNLSVANYNVQRWAKHFRAKYFWFWPVQRQTHGIQLQNQGFLLLPWKTNSASDFALTRKSSAYRMPVSMSSQCLQLKDVGSIFALHVPKLQWTVPDWFHPLASPLPAYKMIVNEMIEGMGLKPKINRWMKEGMKWSEVKWNETKRMNSYRGEWMHACMNEWTNESMNKWKKMNEWIL